MTAASTIALIGAPGAGKTTVGRQLAARLDLPFVDVDARIEATDQIIADAQRRRSELTSELERELQAQREGYANNTDPCTYWSPAWPS